MPNPLEWFPWLLVILGAACVPLSSILYPQYLAATRWLWSSRGFMGRWLIAVAGEKYQQQVEEKLDQVQVTILRQAVNTFLSFAMFSLGVFWLWLAGKVRL